MNDIQESNILDFRQVLDTIFETAKAGFCVTDMSGNIVEVNPAYCTLHGYTRQELIGKPFTIVLPENAKKFAVSLHVEFIQGRTDESSGEWQVVDKQGRMKEVSITEERMVASNGERYKISTVTDITEKIQDIERLKKALQEKDGVVKEINHRIKNNLNLISGLLFLQAEKIKSQPETYYLFQESMNRIRTMSLIHEQFHSQDGFSSIEMKGYLSSVCKNLQSTYMQTAQHVTIDLSIDDIHIDMDKAIACGLIVNEVLSNSLKYAFKPEQPGKIALHVLTDQTRINIEIRDNGKGLPADFDIQKAQTLGMQLINILSGQLHGKPHMERSEGTVFKLSFDA